MKVFKKRATHAVAVPIQINLTDAPSPMYTDAPARILSSLKSCLLALRQKGTQARPVTDIPATFLEMQARFILALKDLEVERDDATWLLRISPAQFSEAQILCVQDMLALDAPDFCLTLADAMAPCSLRGQLLRGRGFEDSEFCRLRRLCHRATMRQARELCSVLPSSSMSV